MRGPNPTELRTQLLTLLQDQKVHALSDVKESIAKKFDVSENERKKLSSKRSRPNFDSRIFQVLSLLRKDGLIVNEARGSFKITKAGLIESKKA